ncbi:MAG TPA: hypothetical protein VJ508_07185, partial [Saprospiraceae bacterium]|nr:hypothetical protein [Saprospiraceae bacterium]
MNANYVRVAIGLLLYYAGISVAISQSGGPEFLNCSSVPVSLCVNDPGVRLPATNQLFLGDLNQEASSCSVQVSDS